MIYVASSWRCALQQAAVHLLRASGLKVYDFREPTPGQKGFAWSDIDPDWKGWDPSAFRRSLTHPVAVKGFEFDKGALDAATAGLLVMPCGRSAHLELGYLAGRGIPTAVLLNEPSEPELMYRLADEILVGFDELLTWAEKMGAKIPA